MVRVLQALTTWAVVNEVELTDLNVARPTLEDVYLKLTSDELTSDPVDGAQSSDPVDGAQSSDPENGAQS